VNGDYLTDPTPFNIFSLDSSQSEIKLGFVDSQLYINNILQKDHKFNSTLVHRVYFVKGKTTKGLVFSNISNCTAFKNDILLTLRRLNNDVDER
jgi:hypothetical protein